MAKPTPTAIENSASGRNDADLRKATPYTNPSTTMTSEDSPANTRWPAPAAVVGTPPMSSLNRVTIIAPAKALTTSRAVPSIHRRSPGEAR
jgi:hypothetical protein